uniref:Uncharacterized protein n=1 Tax=Marmota marmota marmota TaxID=9994 RepID=A0A8C5ZF97_MARMA
GFSPVLGPLQCTTAPDRLDDVIGYLRSTKPVKVVKRWGRSMAKIHIKGEGSYCPVDQNSMAQPRSRQRPRSH